MEWSIELWWWGLSWLIFHHQMIKIVLCSIMMETVSCQQKWPVLDIQLCHPEWVNNLLPICLLSSEILHTKTDIRGSSINHLCRFVTFSQKVSSVSCWRGDLPFNTWTPSTILVVKQKSVPAVTASWNFLTSPIIALYGNLCTWKTTRWTNSLHSWTRPYWSCATRWLSSVTLLIYGNSFPAYWYSLLYSS